MQKLLVSHWKLPYLQWFLGWKLLQWQQLQSSKLAWLFWPFEPNLELEQSNLFIGIDNFSGLARSVDRGEYNVENLKLSRDHHKNQKTRPKGKYIFYLFFFHWGPFLYYVRVFRGFLEPPTHLKSIRLLRRQIWIKFFV